MTPSSFSHPNSRRLGWIFEMQVPILRSRRTQLARRVRNQGDAISARSLWSKAAVFGLSQRGTPASACLVSSRTKIDCATADLQTSFLPVCTASSVVTRKPNCHHGRQGRAISLANIGFGSVGYEISRGDAFVVVTYRTTDTSFRSRFNLQPAVIQIRGLPAADVVHPFQRWT